MSIAQVAQKAGVSQATVSYVINNKPVVSPETVEKVKKAIEELGYVPRPSQSRQKGGVSEMTLKSGNIGVVIPDGVMSESQLNSRLFEAIHTDLERRSLRLVLMRVARGANMTQVLAGNQMLSEMDGLLLFYPTSMLVMTDRPAAPCVSVLGHPDPMERLLCDHVEPDNIRVGAMAARYLYEKGHQRMAAMKPSTQPHMAMDLRCQQFCAGVQALGGQADLYHIPIELPGVGFGQEPLAQWLAGYRAMADKPTGIFVPSDAHLAVVFNAFRQAGIEPGRDVDFIGCNNESMILSGLSPTPASIDIRPDVMARTAIDLLLQRVADSGDDTNPCFTTTYVEPALIEVK